MLQDELVVLVHDLEVANACLVLSDLMGSVEASTDVSPEVITRVQLFITGLMLASQNGNTRTMSYLGDRLRRMFADASTHAADVQSSVELLCGSDGFSPCES